MNEPISALPSIHPALVHLHDPPFDDYPDSYFNVLHEGQLWMVGTTPHMLLAVSGQAAFLPPRQTFKKASAENCRKVLEYPQFNTISIQTSAEALYAWTGEVMPEEQIDCECCGGKSVCYCESCETKHACGVCEGSGKVDYYVSRTGWLMEQLLGMNKLSRIFHHLSGECTITLRANPNVAPELPMLRFDGPDWIALLMPMMPPKDTEPQPPADTPAFKPNGV